MRKPLIISLKPLALVIISAAVLALSFSSFNLEFLVWFALVPLFFALEGKSKLQSFFIAYLCGLLFFALSMYWLIYVTGAGWVILSLYQALYFGIFGLFFSYFAKKSIVYHLSSIIYFALPSIWVLLEYIRSILGGGIGWNLLGYSQYKNLSMIQIADITGAWGVSFLIMLMNVAVYSTIKMAIKCYRIDPKLRAKGNLTLAQELKVNPVIQTFVVLVLFIAALIYGHLSLADGAEGEDIKISVVQGNIEQRLKWDEDYKKYIMDKYENLTLKTLKDKPDLIIWPETAVPGFLNYDMDLRQWLKELVRKVKTLVLTGAPIAEEDSDKNYNSAILFSRQGDILSRHDKLHLVTFGEFIPFEEKFPFLRKLFPISGRFISGEEFTVFKLQTIPRHTRDSSPKDPERMRGANYKLQTNFSVLICFEDIFPGLVREFVRKGADFMVNITNDAWFGKTCAAYQHAASSVFRAVENRRPFIRSANTGLSCFIDKYGRIYAKVSKDGKDLFIEGVKSAKVMIDKDKTLTFYTKYGDFFLFFCAIVLVIVIVRKMLLTI